MPWNFPIFLTWMRVLLIPVFTALFFLPKGVFDNHTINWLAAAIFAIAAITDWFDGFLARRWKQTSDFGAFLDPVADKLMVAVDPGRYADCAQGRGAAPELCLRFQPSASDLPWSWPILR